VRVFLLLFLLGAGTPVQAQFNFNLNRAIESVKNLGRATMEIDEKQEIEIGRDMAARLLGAAPLANDARLQRYVNNVGRWLASQTERPDLPWQFGVLDTPGVNAFAVPGGTIFVTKGLVQRMKSEAELAGVLAHEIGHVVKKHHLKAIQKNAQASLAGEALNMATQDRNSEARGKLVSFGTEMYSRGLDKGDELEADRLGVRIMAKAEYDPRGMIRVMETLAAAAQGQARPPEFFSTHPSPESRIPRIRDAIERLYPQGVPEGLTR
jgi:beta-barrel assembly-enhancing protease